MANCVLSVLNKENDDDDDDACEVTCVIVSDIVIASVTYLQTSILQYTTPFPLIRHFCLRPYISADEVHSIYFLFSCRDVITCWLVESRVWHTECLLISIYLFFAGRRRIPIGQK